MEADAISHHNLTATAYGHAGRATRPSRRPSSRTLARVAALASLLALAASAAPADESELAVTGMTFVSSRDDDNEIVLRAKRAIYRTASETADLEGVSARVSTAGSKFAFSMTCDTGELNLDTNDFVAQGSVEGETDSGQRFSTAWVRYDHEAGELFTDAPVVIREDSGTYRGGGFRYLVRERRFKLLRGASVIQESS
jgi:LPS export ABC transporter protein LptC